MVIQTVLLLALIFSAARCGVKLAELLLGGLPEPDDDPLNWW